MDTVKSYLNQAVSFIREAYAELAKVHYPSPKETIQATIVVVALSFVMALWLGLVDVGATRAVRFLIG
jgi:preprotein translocase subunit SecE